MRQGQRIGIGVALASALAAVAAAAAVAAPGDTEYTGETAEGAPVKLTVADPGNATKFHIGKTKVKCERGGKLSIHPATYTGFDTSDPGSFSDKRSSQNHSGAYRFKNRSSFSGKVAESGDAWSGKLKLTTKVYKQADQVDVCKLKTTWDAS